MSITIKKIKLPNGEHRYEVCVRTNGRGSARLRRRFKTRTEAEAFVHDYQLRKLEIQKYDPTRQDFEETTFRLEAERWLTIQGDRFSPGHLKRAKGVLKEFLPRFGNLSPNKLHPGFLTTIQADELAKGLVAATVNRKLEIVTAILNFAAKQRRIPYNPTIGFQKLQEVHSEIQFWEREEAESFLVFADKKYPLQSSDRWIYVVYLLALNAALRAGEIWGLQVGDIAFGGEVLLIQRQFDRVKKEFRTTKGKKGRRVPCNSEVLKELRHLIDQQKLSNAQILFRRANGTAINHDNFNGRFERDVAKWGGRKIRFHDLRHTAISLMIASGLDLKTVQDIAGHKDIKTTINYAHLLAERIKHVARTFVIKPTEEMPPEQNKPNLRLLKFPQQL